MASPPRIEQEKAQQRTRRFDSIADIKKLPPMRWLKENALPKCGLVLVYGEPGCGKSLYVQALCEPLLDRHRALWIPAEGFSGLRNRFGHLAEDANIRFDLSIPKLIEIPQLADECGADIVVIDPLADFLGNTDENDSAAMAVPVDALKRIGEERCVIVVHHANKAGRDKWPSLSACRGSSRLTGAVDVAIHVASGEHDDLVQVGVAKNKDGAKPRFTYRIAQRGESVKLVEEKGRR